MQPKLFLLLMICFTTVASLSAQTVILTDDPTYTTGQASAVLDVKSTSKGFLLPRMTQAQRTAVASPAQGLMVYQTDGTAGIYYYTNSAWTFLTAGGAAWSITGNAGTNYATNFLGTTDNTSLRFRTNNTQGMILDSLGNVGIGSSVTFTSGANEKLLVNAGATSSFNAVVARGSVNNYFQLNINNQNSGSGASSDVVATADNGTESTNYVDLGINSSTYNTSSITGGPDNAYLYSTSNDFVIGNASASRNLIFFTGGSASSNEAMRINGSGYIGVNKTSPAYRVDVHGKANFDSTVNATNYSSTFQTLSYAASLTWDQTKGSTAAVTLTGNTTLSITNAVAGMYGLIRVTQDATGGRTLTLPSGSKVINGGGGAVTLTTTGGATDVLSYFYDGTNYYWTVGYNYN